MESRIDQLSTNTDSPLHLFLYTKHQILPQAKY